MQDIDLIKFISLSRKHNLLSGLAGSLHMNGINELIRLKPDYLGFRGALCEGNIREQKISANKLHKLQNAFSENEPAFIHFLHHEPKKILTTSL
jgi:(5-formylfuran-3-yl)methyl phosphate synthase